MKILKNFKEDGQNGELPSCLAYSPDGNHLVVGTSAGNIHLYDPSTSIFSNTPIPIS